jgi:ribonuclease P protein component
VLDSPRKSLKYLKEYRLTHKSELQSVFACSVKVTHKYLLALYCPNTLDHARLGIVVTKARLPKAVDRNRVKRAIREAFRHQLADLPAIDVIVMLRGKCAEIKTGDLRADVDKLIELAIISKG